LFLRHRRNDTGKYSSVKRWVEINHILIDGIFFNKDFTELLLIPQSYIKIRCLDAVQTAVFTIAA